MVPRRVRPSTPDSLVTQPAQQRKQNIAQQAPRTKTCVHLSCAYTVLHYMQAVRFTGARVNTLYGTALPLPWYITFSRDTVQSQKTKYRWHVPSVASAEV
eukprot:TRINITY_DN1096_c1_g1_i1.p5 TRINITY_DN1096_c1_g1~~TRINITY_DN1096_c1_g1_i1.p5  ORF type:complete len:100 (+),score=2.29 TRINITY_DN1096_c1_g1_i1:179-478(+)